MKSVILLMSFVMGSQATADGGSYERRPLNGSAPNASASQPPQVAMPAPAASKGEEQTFKKPTYRPRDVNESQGIIFNKDNQSFVGEIKVEREEWRIPEAAIPEGMTEERYRKYLQSKEEAYQREMAKKAASGTDGMDPERRRRYEQSLEDAQRREEQKRAAQREQLPASQPVAFEDSTRSNHQGPGWPSNVYPSIHPLLTGAMNESGDLYTDAKDDSMMAAMVEAMNQLDSRYGAGFQSESEQLSQAISAVNLSVDRQVARLELELAFSNNKELIKSTFQGVIKNRRAELQLLRSNSSYQFKAQIICVDSRTDTCHNAIIVVDHYLNGQFCRRAYVNHRWMGDFVGDGHFTLSYGDAKFWAASNNRAYRAFMRITNNTIVYNDVINGLRNKSELQLPRWRYLGLRSWAAAYGASYFELRMIKTSRYGNNRVLGDSNQGDNTLIHGWLTKPRLPGEVTQKLEVAGTYKEAEDSDKYLERFDSSTVQLAQLIDNDGRGNLTLKVVFKPDTFLFFDTTKTEEAVINFSGLRVDVLDFDGLRELLRN